MKTTIYLSLVVTSLLITGCVSPNTCVIDATIQQKRLIDAGLEARVGKLIVGNNLHAICSWTDATGKKWIWDSMGSMRWTGDEQEIENIIEHVRNTKAKWIGWL